MGTATRSPWRDVYTYTHGDDFEDCASRDELRRRLLALPPEDDDLGPFSLAIGLTETPDSLWWLTDGRMHLMRPVDTIHSLARATLERALDVFDMFAARDFAALEALPWEPGDGDPRTPAERAVASAAAAERRLQRMDRALLAELGAEALPGAPLRGRVEAPVSCRLT